MANARIKNIVPSARSGPVGFSSTSISANQLIPLFPYLYTYVSSIPILLNQSIPKVSVRTSIVPSARVKAN